MELQESLVLSPMICRLRKPMGWKPKPCINNMNLILAKRNTVTEENVIFFVFAIMKCFRIDKSNLENV
jgi:hypothetical protein